MYIFNTQFPPDTLLYKSAFSFYILGFLGP